VWCFGVKTPAYSVVVDGNKQFIVENADDVNMALNQLNDESSAQRVAYRFTLANRSQLVKPDNVVEQLTLALQPKALATAMVVNGQTIVAFEDRAAAESLLEKLKTDYTLLAPGETLLSVGFAEDVQLIDGYVPLNKIMSAKDASNIIKIGTNNLEVYKIQPGDSLWSIARKHDMYVSDIVQTNQIREDAILALGQEIILNKPQPLVTVVAQVQGSGNVVIPYETETITDNSVNGVRVKTEGQNGEQYVAYTAITRNGELESKQVLEEKLIKAAVNKVVLKGKNTYQVASRGSSSGRLIWPVSGSISQSYGGRHTGLDIAGSTGSSVVAADGGAVSFSGWEGGYGNFVIINHGNGLTTRYAHLSKRIVSSGQYVDQGQTIGLRGSTGRSTGPHLHFEVLQNGSFRNPLSYLR
jgi:murein DD-endopeptidase MepM/ murein hydrolase activator NlpD